MLYVEYTNHSKGVNDKPTKTLQFHIGNEIAYQRFSEIANDVVNIQADGDELNLIYDSFSNIPKPTSIHRNPCVTWYGDIAKFIVWNLPRPRQV